MFLSLAKYRMKIAFTFLKRSKGIALEKDNKTEKPRLSKALYFAILDEDESHYKDP